MERRDSCSPIRPAVLSGSGSGLSSGSGSGSVVGNRNVTSTFSQVEIQEVKQKNVEIQLKKNKL